jgi:hypothetical protein
MVAQQEGRRGRFWWQQHQSRGEDGCHHPAHIGLYRL